MAQKTNNFESSQTVDLTTVPRTKDVNSAATVQFLKIPEIFDKLVTPARIVISGPTQSGKSHFIYELIKHRKTVFDNDFEQIVYCLPSNCFNLHIDYIKFIT